MSSLTETLAALRQDEARLMDALERGSSGLCVSRGLADAMDQFLITHYTGAATGAPELRQQPGQTPASPTVIHHHGRSERAPCEFPLALIALGGQGRRERSPKSDVDVLILHAAASDDAQALKTLSDRFLYPLWDAKLDVGHGVRTVGETLALCEKNEATLTSHLDARLLAGDAGLFASLQQDLKRAFAKRGADYVQRLLEPIRERARAESLVFVLEPNLKSGPGGLRDIHQIGWVTGFRYGASDLRALLKWGILSPREHTQLVAARSFYLRMRAFMHLLAKRRQDQITFEFHRELAERIYLRSAPDANADGSGHPRDVVERLLSRHYGHAQQVIDIKHRLFSRIDDELRPKATFRGPKRLRDGFYNVRQRLGAGGPEYFTEHPHDMLRVFVSSLEHELPIADGTLDALIHSLHLIDDRFRADPDCAQMFWRVIDHPHGDRALVDMHYAGVLGRYIPEFGRTRSMVQADFYHYYTVDVHSLHVLALLYQLRRGEGDGEFAPLVQAEQSFRSLVMGCLFHDAGKRSGQKHELYGAELCERAMVRLAAPLADIVDAQTLVREHLTMPKVSQRRDLSDPELIAGFAATVGELGRLRRLYVLSYVDTHGTGPTLWTPWKAALLKEMYERTRRHLQAAAEPASSDHDGRPSGVPAAAHDPTLPARMAAVLAASEVSALADARRLGTKVFLGALIHGHRPLYVVARDRPGLLAIVAGVCAEKRMSIASAELFSSTDGFALDRFMVRYDAPPGLDAEEIAAAAAERYARLAAELERVLDAGAVTVPVRLQRPRALAPALLPEVRVRPGERTALGQVVDVYAPDRPGLLHDLARTIFEMGYSIDVARISTEGARAIDAFYVHAARPDAPPLDELCQGIARAARES